MNGPVVSGRQAGEKGADISAQLTVFQHLNVVDDNLADVAQSVWRAGVERFEDSAVVYA